MAKVLDRLGDDGAEELRRTNFSLLRRAVTVVGRTEVSGLDDGLIVACATPVHAVDCAFGMQRP